MPIGPDSVYAGPGANDYTRPWSGNEEYLTEKALESSFIPGRFLQETVKPPLPQIEAFPNRFGYGNPVDRTLRIEDVVNVDDRYKLYDFSGRKSGYESSMRPSLGG